MSRRLRRILSKSPPPIAREESDNITKTYPGTGFDGLTLPTDESGGFFSQRANLP
ncbi:hypothetical protein [Microcoleus sp. CAWBG58]|uniref:hypothetical protein n=1 Tax=Microcoleus sp. CAWBG58 TaxID=2841651 RepID=UPI0025D6F1BC|nr:hypothetical protein [Microcoleus sp. CAWBG58]